MVLVTPAYTAPTTFCMSDIKKQHIYEYAAGPMLAAAWP